MEQDLKKEAENFIEQKLETENVKKLKEQEDNSKEPDSLGEQEDSRTKSQSNLEREDNREEADSSAEQEVNRKKSESCVEREGNMDKGKSPMEEDIKKKAESPAGMSSKCESSKRKNSKSLKAKPKIRKTSLSNKVVKATKTKVSPKIQGEETERKDESSLQRNNGSGNNEKEDNKIRSLNVDDKNNKEEHHMKSNQGHPKQEKTNKPQKSHIKLQNKTKFGASDKRQKNQKNKEKIDEMERSRRTERSKGKLGGLIFMCSGKTKPDCFRHRIMGVSLSKKDLVLGIKPGLKLFLYDFDLKLLYGIYQASSSGGMKLEPKAFNGAFPAQVRFNVYKDCFPLPESIFKRAIMENYNEKKKFKVELTVKQVRKLTELFRPAEYHSSTLPVRSPPRFHNRKVVEGVREARSIDSFANGGDSRSYHLLAHERDRPIAQREVAPPRREEIPRDLFLSEKDYRTYGLHGARRDLDPVSHPASDPYQRDYDREYPLRHPDPPYREDAYAQRGTRLADPLYMNDREYQSYNIRPELPSASRPSTGASPGLESYVNDDPYYIRQYGRSPGYPFLHPSRREDAPIHSLGGRYHGIDNDPIRRRETDQVDRLYSTYAADAPSYNNPDHRRTSLKTTNMPVSSRYTFAGPSYR